jgi:hypothetical protein
LRDAPKVSGGQVGGRRKKDGSRTEPSIRPETLTELGLNKKVSSVAQQLAALSPEKQQAIAARKTTLTRELRHRRAEERKRRLARINDVPAAPAREPLKEVADASEGGDLPVSDTTIKLSAASRLRVHRLRDVVGGFDDGDVVDRVLARAEREWIEPVVKQVH